MNQSLSIIKRDGTAKELDINKIHKVVNFACEGLAGVSSSQIQMGANIQFTNMMSSRQIQDLLIRSANDLISLENPNYQFAAHVYYYTEYIKMCMVALKKFLLKK